MPGREVVQGLCGLDGAPEGLSPLLRPVGSGQVIPATQICFFICEAERVPTTRLFLSLYELAVHNCITSYAESKLGTTRFQGLSMQNNWKEGELPSGSSKVGHFWHQRDFSC